MVSGLEEAWRAPVPGAGLWHDLDDARGDGLWPAPDMISAVSAHAVTTYDAATGAVRSTVPLDGSVCAASRDVNDDGIGVVALGPLEDCRTLVAVDTTAGRVRWQVRLDDEVVLNDVSAGARVVAVTGVRGAWRFRVDDGAALPAMVGGEAASNGRFVVVTPERGGAAESYDVYDQDSGEQLWSLPAEASTAVEVIVSSEPLVVTAYEWGDDGTYLRDLSGDRPRRVGRRINAGYPHLTQYVALDGGGAAAVQYGASPVVETWTADRPLEPASFVLDPEEIVVDQHAGRLITLTPATGRVAGDTSVVRAVDPTDPADPWVLGTAPADRSSVLLATRTAAVVDDLLVVPLDEELVAVELPDEAPATSEVLAGEGLTDGELTPAEGGDLCPAIRPATLEALGFALPDHEVAADCDLRQVRGVDVSLEVDSWAVRPSWEDQLTATEAAGDEFAEIVAGGGAYDLPDLQPVDDLGDQAAVGARGEALVVRVANVLVVVQRIGGLPGLDPATERALLLQVGRDLADELERRRRATSSTTGRGR
ncbi:outer membrane protein assembly factor BamB family protein [Nocardioides pelophilus]|uniref:outer membrane protein assembly factor BamB family protein n=1 Tax=Nocardioides pelophilus TaxID=2172019 RepID=UPI001600051E|nr:PQQ-binding-like beta-propeller repeat protein [Nocardioides pelophilus]